MVRRRRTVCLYLSINFSKETVRTYLGSVSLYARWFEHEGVSLSQATAQDLERWFSHAIQRKARSTVVNQMLSVRYFYRWLKQRGERTDDPTAAIPASCPR